MFCRIMKIIILLSIALCIDGIKHGNMSISALLELTEQTFVSPNSSDFVGETCWWDFVGGSH